MAVFTPDDHTFAHGIIFNGRVHFFNAVKINKQIALRFVCLKDTEDPGEFIWQIPVFKIVHSGITVNGIIQNNGVFRIKFLQELTDFRRFPAEHEVPAGNQKRRMRILGSELADEFTHHLTFECKVFFRITVNTFCQSDDMEQFAFSVMSDMRTGQLHVTFNIFIFAAVPDLHQVAVVII